MTTPQTADEVLLALLVDMQSWLGRNQDLCAKERVRNWTRTLRDRLRAQQPAQAQVVDVDWLANVIRTADGNHTLGAGVLAEKIVEALKATKS